MHKLKLDSISGNTDKAVRGYDPSACQILHDFGFRHRDELERTEKPEWPNQLLSIGAEPDPGKEFYVYYDGPLGDVKRDGTFRLVRIDDGREVELDHGTMSLGHYNKGTYPTYYGKGLYIQSYSFHVNFTDEEAAANERSRLAAVG